MSDGTFKDRTAEIVGGYHEMGLDGLIVIGGDGSMKDHKRNCRQRKFKYSCYTKNNRQ